MKKKPSLLDIELFAEKRATEKQKELLKIEEESDTSVFESLSQDDSLSQEPDTPENIEWVNERLNSVINTTDTHQDEINKLKQEMFKLKEQLRVYHSFLSSQQKKITELENRKAETPKNQGIIDENYIKLLLKNIVWLKEEKDFTTNDVVRLFRAEGFQTPHPHEQWDENVINILYKESKRSFL